MQRNEFPTEKEKLQNESNKKTFDYTKFILSASANLAIHPILHPGDTVLKRLQNNQGKIFNYNGDVITSAKNSAKLAKKVIFPSVPGVPAPSMIQSLYKGFAVSGLYKFMVYPLKYAGQPIVNKELKNFLEIKDESHTHAMQTFLNGTSAAIVGIAEVALIPWNSIQTKLQSGTSEYKNVWDIVKNEKWKLYRGSGPALARNVPGTAAFFTGYSEIMKLYDLKNPEDASFTQHLTAASFGSFCSSVLTNPQDVIKTRMQNQSKEDPHTNLSMLSMFKQVVKNEGIGALGKGAGVRIVNSISKAAIPAALTSYLPTLWNEYRNKKLPDATVLPEVTKNTSKPHP